MPTDPRLARPLWRGRTNLDALTISCIEHAEQIVRDEAPKIAHEFVCTQGSYQGDSGDPDSGTTHRLGGGSDWRWCGHWVCYEALRKAGMFIWHRKPLWRNGVLVWPDHFHGAPLDHPYMDPMLERQETAYLNRRNGLADNGPDDGPRLDPIPRPVWPWPPEDDMKPEDWTRMSDLIDERIAAALDAPDDTKRGKRSIRQQVKELYQKLPSKP